MGTEVKVNSEKRLNIFSEDSRNGEITKTKVLRGVGSRGREKVSGKAERMDCRDISKPLRGN